MNYDIQLVTLTGESTNLTAFADKALLIVNVASKCGLTPQYKGLQQLQERYAQRGFAVLGFPCNQFGAQEPGSETEIEAFCTTNYGVNFPMFSKVEVNGEGRHPLYQQLTETADDEGNAGDVVWNFEKFLVVPGGAVRRFRPTVAPDDAKLVAAIESALSTD